MVNKYNAIRTDYKGSLYDSRKEAEFAQELDLLKKAKKKADRVIRWDRQVRYDIKVKGKYIGFYKLDFRVYYDNNSVKNFDVKGYKKGCGYSMFRLKKKLVEALHGIVIEEV